MASLNLASIIGTGYASKIPRWIVRCMTDNDFTPLGADHEERRFRSPTGLSSFSTRLYGGTDPAYSWSGPGHAHTALAKDDSGQPSPSTVLDDKSDEEKMQGKWRIIRCEFAGQDPPQPVGVEDTISGAKWLQPNRRTGEYRLKLDPSKLPSSGFSPAKLWASEQ